MECPQCKAKEGLKWFLRHQKSDESDENTDANCITMLCTACGFNESYLLEDLLPEIFTNWAMSFDWNTFNGAS